MKRTIPPEPEPARSLDEIVDDIVRELGDVPAARAEVRGLILRMAVGEARWDRVQRKKEADHAQRIDDHFAEIEPMLADPLAPRFNRQIYSTLARVTGVIREVCQEQMKVRPRDGREVDQLKRDCANAALHLMQKFSRHKISGTAGSSFPVVAMLLFEAVSDQPDADMKRATEHVLRKRHRLLKIGAKVISQK
jgi:hypothetical protein